MAAPTIKLYTNPSSPWSQRVHIALGELQLPYEAEIVDLTQPRTPEYLLVNPKGQVPALSYNGDIITESAEIATFLADAFPSTLLPAPADSAREATQQRITSFVQTYFQKVASAFMKVQQAKSDEDRTAALANYVDAAATELDPLLADAAPFFAGSSRLTLAEILLGPFLLRAYLLPKVGLLPESLLADLAAKAPVFDKWAKQAITHPSLTGSWDEEMVAAHMKSKAKKAQAAK
ncbi:glutathione S-transferase domain-containing protein [Lasiosphaeris hirsuta]|uniref:Glutathione S-transferase domain-containing protein n=1 Tax=Lasiosphaeris hirsuta TaxID=260670 RepID=A0AA40B8F3_9PEZI|nr:glutathione S-transferase domain-containing protein [Lasiosphaeris hirsuta]